MEEGKEEVAPVPLMLRAVFFHPGGRGSLGNCRVVFVEDNAWHKIELASNTVGYTGNNGKLLYEMEGWVDPESIKEKPLPTLYHGETPK